MEIAWDLSPAALKRVTTSIEPYLDDEYVKIRINTNVSLPPPPLCRSVIWEVLFDCLLSTQQRSGPDSAMARFQHLKPYPFRYEECVEIDDLAGHVNKTLTDFGGIRWPARIGDQAANNFAWLEEQGGWSILDTVFEELHGLRSGSPDWRHRPTERRTAQVLTKLEGIGQKQSRNMLQLLGLTRFEIPLDSRFMTWLGAVKVVRTDDWKTLMKAVYSPGVYHEVLDHVQALARNIDMLPCVLDACVFTSFDKQAS